MVDLSPPGNPLPLRFVLSDAPTAACQALLAAPLTPLQQQLKGFALVQQAAAAAALKAAVPGSDEALRETLALAASAAHAKHEPNAARRSSGGSSGGSGGSSNLRAGPDSPSASAAAAASSHGAAPGDELEACPLACALVQDVAARVARHRGGALFVDYGETHALPASLRGFWKHNEQHVLFRPGEVGVTRARFLIHTPFTQTGIWVF
jgi:hypothetical protein